MSRRADPNNRADETVTVRLPYGTAAKLRAATGQPFSRLVRFVVLELLKKHAPQEDARKELQAEVADIVNEQ